MKGVRVSAETVCEPAVAQRLRPGHQSPVSLQHAYLFTAVAKPSGL